MVNTDSSCDYNPQLETAQGNVHATALISSLQ